MIKLNDYKINTLNYKYALNNNKSTFFEYYLSLLRTKHPIIFSFYIYDDFNSKIIKKNYFFSL